MPLEQVEFQFPDEQEKKKVEAEETEIEIVDDTPEEDRGREPMKTPPPVDLTDEDLEKYDISVRKRISQVQKGYHDERRAKEVALREREEAVKMAHVLVEENKKLKGSLSQGQNALIEQAKKVVANELEQARRKYKEAYEAGDSDALLDAQEKLTSVKLKSDRLTNYKPTPVQSTATDVKIPQNVTPEPQIDPKLRAWQDSNSWFGPNKRMTAYALGLHEDLVTEGIPAGSDEYYRRVDTEMRNRFSDMFESEKPESAHSSPRKSNVVAPATRSTAPKKVVLTKSQVAIANRLQVPLALYARKAAEVERMGG